MDPRSRLALRSGSGRATTFAAVEESLRLGSCTMTLTSCAVQLRHDVGALDAPSVRPGVEVDSHQMSLDARSQVSRAVEAAFADAVSAEVAEHALHGVDPQTGRGHKVHVKTRTLGQPLLEFGVLHVALVGHQMQLQFAGDLAMDLLKNLSHST